MFQCSHSKSFDLEEIISEFPNKSTAEISRRRLHTHFFLKDISERDFVARTCVFIVEEGFSWTSNSSLFCTSESFLKCCLLPASIRKHMAISLRSPDKPVSLRMLFLKEPRLTFSTVSGTLTYFLSACGLRRNILIA